MPNLLNDQALWSTQNAEFVSADGHWLFPIAGVYSGNLESRITLQDPIPANATLRANLSSTLDAGEFDYPSFTVVVSGETRFTRILLFGEESFLVDLDLADDEGGWIQITMSQPFSYGVEGLVTAVPIADSGEPGEPGEEEPTVEPWWMCSPKADPVECPVRPTGFVPFADYDEDFKFPLSSSRKPAPNPRLTNCIACRPNLIDPDGSVDPDPSDPDPADCIQLTFYGTGGNNEVIQINDVTNLPNWFDPETGFQLELTYDGNTASTSYVPRNDSSGFFDYFSGDVLNGPLEGTGTLEQNENTFCVVWTLNEGI